jgi:hypothetical protein
MHRTVTITPIVRPSTFESGFLLSPREKVRYSVARPAHSSRTASTSDVARKVVPERRTALESAGSLSLIVIGEIARVDRFVWGKRDHRLKQGKVPVDRNGVDAARDLSHGSPSSPPVEKPG